MISADGRFVTFSSLVTKLLVSGDNNFKQDIFVYSMQTGEFTRVSVASNGAEANDHSYTPVISADGRLVAFMSGASNLMPGDTNGLPDIFVHDRGTGQTRRVSVAADGTQTSGQSADSRLPSISADGRYVAFQTNASNLVPVDTNNALDIFLTDLQSGDIRIVSIAYDGSQGDYQSMAASVSADGSFVAFGSSAHNLVADDTNNKRDIFVCGGVKKLEVFLPLIIRK
jgi:Tol biopolymer transport system component